MGFRASVLISALAVSLAAAVALADDSGRTRTISFYHIHTQETLTVTYKRDGKFIPEALKQINWLMRDWRENKVIDIDPNTIDILWEMHEELGSKEPISVICGHRSRSTNEMLRRTVGGQASQSQHITGKAIDVAFPDVPARLMRYSAMIRERGGVGYYPTSAIPFVHVDTSRVRHWPNMPRNELALLFPSGHTLHRPAEGGSLTPADVRAAKARGGETATQLAAYFTLRDQPKPTVLVADAGNTSPPLEAPAPVPAVRPARPPAPGQKMALAAPVPSPSELKWSATTRVTGDAPASAKPISPPKLVAEPRLVERPSKFVPAPTEVDRRGLNALVAKAADSPATKTSPGDGPVVASLEPGLAEPPTPGNATKPAPQIDEDANFIPAPEYDEDHPEELVYRPFPLAPLLTATPSADDAALSLMQSPDVSKTLAMLDDDMTSPPMRLRPGRQAAEMVWSKEFRGQAVELVDLAADRPEGEPAGRVADRMVKTTSR